METYQKVLDETCKLLQEKKLEEIRTSEICEKAFVSKSTLSRHFKIEGLSIKESIAFMVGESLEEKAIAKEWNSQTMRKKGLPQILLETFCSERAVFCHLFTYTKKAVLIQKVVDGILTNAIEKAVGGSISEQELRIYLSCNYTKIYEYIGLWLQMGLTADQMMEQYRLLLKNNRILAQIMEEAANRCVRKE